MSVETLTTDTPTIYKTTVPNTVKQPSTTLRDTLTPRQERYAQLRAAGEKQSEAYITAYKKKGLLPTSAREMACRVEATGNVKARIRELIGKSEIKVILTINDRLQILAKDAQSEGNGPNWINARARAIEVYGKVQGDLPPEKSETTIKGDPAAPIPVVQVPLTAHEKALKHKADYLARHPEEKNAS